MEEDFELGREGFLFCYAQLLFHTTFRFMKLTSPNYENEKPTNLGFPREFTWSFEVEQEIQGLYIQSVINTAMFFEAYIFDYMCRNLGERTAQNLDKLDPPSKYLMSTKLHWDKELKEHIYGEIKEVFKVRNKLVHAKSKNKATVFDMPEIMNQLNPQKNVNLVLEVLTTFSENTNDDKVTEVLIQQIISWLHVANFDLDFYPIPNNSGL